MKKALFCLVTALLFSSCANTPSKNVTPGPTTYDPEVDTSGDSHQGDDSSGEIEEWVPDIIDYDEPVEIEDVYVDKQTYDYSNIVFVDATGTFEYEEGVYTGTKTANLCASSGSSSPFTHGTFAVDMKMTDKSDSGLVFGLSSTKYSDFWEGEGISYYFFFINFEGVPYLGKTSNGTWSECRTAAAIDISDPTATISLKILWHGNKIICFVNDEIVISYRDNNYLMGTRFGLRSGAEGITYENLLVSSDRVI